ncbi:hypothetical protein Hanom_Chr14g01284671 [Helianthus anomalus]
MRQYPLNLFCVYKTPIFLTKTVQVIHLHMQNAKQPHYNCIPMAKTELSKKHEITT